MRQQKKYNMEKERFTIIRKPDPERFLVTTGVDTHYWIADKKSATRFINDQKAVDHLQRSNCEGATLEYVYDN